MTTDFDADGYADFSDERQPVRFSAQGERYEAFSALSVGTAQKIAHIRENIAEPDNELMLLEAFFNLTMDPDSAARLVKQLTEQSPVSITVPQGVKIMHHVMEKNGLRPTQPSSD